jgi:hypothetical protein
MTEFQMTDEKRVPSDDDNIDCHLQQIGMGTLICQAAQRTGQHLTNEVNPTICFNCPAGRVYREIGCEAVLPKVYIFASAGGSIASHRSLFCKIRKRDTDLDECKSCGMVTAETTKTIVSNTRGLFTAQGFYTAFRDIEKSRECIRDGNFDNAITRSISCLESTMRICHEKLNFPLPKKLTVTDLWKSTRTLLVFDEMDFTAATLHLANSINGLITNLGRLRSVLGDAHGKGQNPPDISESIAEFALNSACTLSTLIIRRYNQIQGTNDE